MKILETKQENQKAKIEKEKAKLESKFTLPDLDQRKRTKKTDILKRQVDDYENLQQNMTPEEIDEIMRELENLVKF